MEVLGVYARTSRDSGDFSTIDQQVKAGIDFANHNNMKYKVFQDKGFSGYKIDDSEDKDPFANRPAFSEMIEAIKLGTINAVWVWEHSRLSRNQYASAVIFNLFLKHKIRLYEKDKEYDLYDPNVQLLRSMLDAVAQYERQLIVRRTTRGLYNAIDSGKRSYTSFFGYRKTVKNEKGNYLWEAVPAEIDQLKNWFKRFKNGESLRSIIVSEADFKDTTRYKLTRTSQLSRYMQHFDYTGYTLNTKGLGYLKKFDNFEIDSLQMLRNPDYWVKSSAYPIEIFTREEWIENKERLRVHRGKRKEAKNRKAEKALGTGIIQCALCGSKYFHQIQIQKRNGKEQHYLYYFHHKTIAGACSQKPKSIVQHKIDTILKTFVLYNILASDGETKFLKEQLFQEEIEKKAIKEKLKTLKANRKKLEIQKNKLKKALEAAEDVGTITVLAKQIDNAEGAISEADKNIIDAEIDLENKNADMEKTQAQLLYYSAKDLLIQFFEKWNIEEQRNHLLRVVDSATLNGTKLTILSGGVTYIFNTTKHYQFPQSMYQELLEKGGKNINYLISHHKEEMTDEEMYIATMRRILLSGIVNGLSSFDMISKRIVF